MTVQRKQGMGKMINKRHKKKRAGWKKFSVKRYAISENTSREGKRMFTSTTACFSPAKKLVMKRKKRQASTVPNFEEERLKDMPEHVVLPTKIVLYGYSHSKQASSPGCGLYVFIGHDKQIEAPWSSSTAYVPA